MSAALSCSTAVHCILNTHLINHVVRTTWLQYRNKFGLTVCAIGYSLYTWLRGAASVLHMPNIRLLHLNMYSVNYVTGHSKVNTSYIRNVVSYFAGRKQMVLQV